MRADWLAHSPPPLVHCLRSCLLAVVAMADAAAEEIAVPVASWRGKDWHSFELALKIEASAAEE